MRILVVDDEPQITRVLRTSLQSNGHEVAVAQDGAAALNQFLKAEPELVITDLAMPGMDGIELTREIRARSQVPVIVLSVRNHDAQKVAALDEGADDYITKPFNIRELAARIRAAVRRSSASHIDPDAVVRIGDIELDPARRLVRKGGEPVHFTPTEFNLLHYLITHAGLPITHVRLLRAVWGPEYGGELEYLRTYIRQLRKKLEDDPAEPAYLLTDSHVGYRFAEGAPEIVEKKA
jgi:two-component system KDP operon response regulator KdpE